MILPATPEHEGLRLDTFLARMLPDCTLRGAKRLLERKLVLVDGKVRPAHFRLRTGNVVTIVAETSAAPSPLLDSLRIVAATMDYVAFAKPAGLHTAHVSGSASISLEEALPDLWPMLWAEFQPNTPLPPLPALLTRLDAPTSGLVLAACHPDAATRFRNQEAQGLVQKEYAALVHGHLAAPMLLRRRLNMEGRTKTRVFAEDTPDLTRHTLVIPCEATHSQPPAVAAQEVKTTRVTVRIQRGARHQIRAHLADAGFPILGDTLYGPPGMPEGLLYLHHARLTLPDLAIDCPPEW